MVLLAKMLWWCFSVLMKDMASAVITYLAIAFPNGHVFFFKGRDSHWPAGKQWKSSQRLHSAQRGRAETSTVQHYISKLANIILQPGDFAFNYSFKSLYSSAFVLPSLP